MSVASQKKPAKAPYKIQWENALFKYLQSGASLRLVDRITTYIGQRMFDIAANSSDALSCSVEGTYDDHYEVTISPGTGTLHTDCTCPVGVRCKHALALAVVLAGTARLRGHAFPPELDPTYSRALKAFDRYNFDIKGIEHILGGEAVQINSVLLPDAWWEKIAQNVDWPTQERVFYDLAKQRLPSISPWYINNYITALKAIRNPIQRLRELPQKLDELERRFRYKLSETNRLDPKVETFLNSPLAGELEAKYEKEIAQEDLLEWLREPARAVETQGRVDRLEVTWIPMETEGVFSLLCFQLKAEAKNRGMLSRKPAGIIQMEREVSLRKRNFGPGKNKLVEWIASSHCQSYSGYSDVSYDETLIPVSGVFQWVARWGKLVRWHDGGLIGLSPYSAELTLSPDHNGDPCWVIKFGAHGDHEAREVRLTEAKILVDQQIDVGQRELADHNYYIREGDTLTPVETHGMSQSVLRAISKLGTIPMEILAGTEAGSALFQTLYQGRESAGLSKWVEEIPCRGEVEVGLYNGSDFMVSVRARATEGMWFQWTPEGSWKRNGGEADNKLREVLKAIPEEAEVTPEGASPEAQMPLMPDAAPTAPAGPTLHSFPRRQDVLPLEEWLEEIMPCFTGLQPSEAGHSFSGRLTQANIAAFLQVWHQRPNRVDYYGNPDFQKLVTVRNAPRISIKAESSGMDWLQVSVTLEQEIKQTTLAEMSKVLAASADKFVRLPNGAIYRRAELEEYRDQVNQLNALGLGLTVGNQRLHALHLAGAPDTAIARLEDSGGTFAALAKKSRKILSEFNGIPEASVPEDTGAFLRPYQKTGVNFLTWASANFGGALLADDMGLGKTLQMLATIRTLRETHADDKEHPPGPSLVVCPASVARNWEREAHKFAPSLKVMVLESGSQRREQLQQLQSHDLVIMNFALLRRDIKTLSAINWFVIVADEAQAIKNPNAESSRAVKQLNARYRFALTGTPIENRISDLYSIVEFALPGYLGEMDKSTTSTDPESAARACQLLRSRLRPVLTRRLKVEVAPELPERVETRIDCEMGTAQKKLYAAEVKRVRMMFEALGDESTKGKHRIQMLAALMRLRQICCDPILLGHPEIASGKTDELVELVPPLLEAGHKVLIFSQFVKMLNHLQEQLTEKEIPTYKLTGATTNRQELVDKFENDPTPAAFLISLKAGGTGLNLVSASHVILFDPWWNPSVEAQAIDRAHRIGQDKTVVAYRLVMQGTIEEKILELQEQKRALVRNILEEDSFNRTLTSADFQFLLGE